MLYKEIDLTKDKQYLYDNLSEDSLDIIEYVLEAYGDSKIDLEGPRYPDGEPDLFGEFKLIVKDNTYKRTGYELLILKWVEDFENTGYLLECMR